MASGSVAQIKYFMPISYQDFELVHALYANCGSFLYQEWSKPKRPDGIAGNLLNFNRCTGDTFRVPG